MSDMKGLPRFQNLRWVMLLAGAIESMLRPEHTLKEVRKIGRDALTEIAEANLEDIPADIEMMWRVSALRSKRGEDSE